MACPILIDLRDIYSGDDVDRHEFFYLRLGRASPVRWRTLLYGLKAPFDEVAVDLALHTAPNHSTPRTA